MFNLYLIQLVRNNIEFHAWLFWQFSENCFYRAIHRLNYVSMNLRCWSFFQMTHHATELYTTLPITTYHATLTAQTHTYKRPSRIKFVADIIVIKYHINEEVGLKFNFKINYEIGINHTSFITISHLASYTYKYWNYITAKGYIYSKCY